MAQTNGDHIKPAKVLTILGCGTLGSAILHGLLAKNTGENLQNGVSETLTNGHSSSTFRGESRYNHPSHFIACVRTKRSAARLKHELGAEFNGLGPVKISQGDNVSAVHAASTVILGFQPQDLDICLQEEGLVNALQGKLIISILAGVTTTTLESRINRPSSAESSSPATIIRAMPNTSAIHNASTTLLTTSTTRQTPPDALALTNSLLSAIGSVHPIPAGDMDTCTAVCGSTPAFFALMLEGLLDGAVALGVKRSEAKTLVLETMRGVADSMLTSGDIGGMAEKVCTPGGSSIQGLLVLERNAVRGVLADALCAAAGANGALGRK